MVNKIKNKKKKIRILYHKYFDKGKGVHKNASRVKLGKFVMNYNELNRKVGNDTNHGYSIILNNHKKLANEIHNELKYNEAYKPLKVRYCEDGFAKKTSMLKSCNQLHPSIRNFLVVRASQGKQKIGPYEFNGLLYENEHKGATKCFKKIRKLYKNKDENVKGCKGNGVVNGVKYFYQYLTDSNLYDKTFFPLENNYMNVEPVKEKIQPNNNFNHVNTKSSVKIPSTNDRALELLGEMGFGKNK